MPTAPAENEREPGDAAAPIPTPPSARDAVARVEPASALAPIGTVLLAAAITGAIAGAATGVVDGLWSWSAMAQFAPSAAGRLRVLAYLAAACAVAGIIVGVVVGAGALYLSRATRLGDLARFATRAHGEIRARDPRDAVIGLSLAIAGIPCLVAALGAAFLIALPLLAERRHPGLVVASAMGAGLLAVAAAALAAVVLARPVELGLRALARRPALARALSSPRAPAVAAAVLVAIGGGIVLARSWKVVRLLPLRGPTVVLVALALGAGAWPLGQRLAASLSRRPAWPRRAALVGAVVLLLATLLAAGHPAPVLKAATAYSGLGGALARPLRTLGDLDRDGYSRWLGGGDCDDGDPTTHPGALEIPDDGVDQNCVGGDATAQRSIDDVAFAPVPPAVPADLNVVLITIDTLRADHLGSYGYGRATSPNLDGLAAEGARFVHGWAHAPSTRYSIPAILTGRLPLDVDYDTSVAGWPGLSPRATTIAEVLRERGFATGAILNYDYFAPFRRMNQGFDEYDNDNARLHRGVAGQGPAHTRGSSSKEQTDKAIAFVGRHAAARFFLWVHYYDPHYEYEAHPESPQWGSDKVALYDQEIRYTDLHIGRLFDDLRARGLWGKTAVLVTGDHGEGFGEHGIDLHGYHLYAAQTRVPFLVRVPGLAPRAIETPAAHVDLLPTIANLAGATAATTMMGRSLVDVIAGGPEVDRVVFQQLSYEGNHEMRAAADRRCHVVYNVSPHSSWEVYRIDRDPGEQHDLEGDPGPCASTRTALERWYDASRIPEGAAEALLRTRPAIAAPLDVDLGAEVRLLAVDLPARAHAGDVVDVTWTFEARGRPEPGWKVFAHFEGERGGRFTGDHAPVRPLEWWRAGQLIRYTTSVAIPASAQPGRYALWTGLWKGAKRQPARAPSAPIVDDRAQVATIEVTRREAP